MNQLSFLRATFLLDRSYHYHLLQGLGLIKIDVVPVKKKICFSVMRIFITSRILHVFITAVLMTCCNKGRIGIRVRLVLFS